MYRVYRVSIESIESVQNVYRIKRENGDYRQSIEYRFDSVYRVCIARV